MKIDRSFVREIRADSKNIEIVQAIIRLAHQLGINVTAEGVETTEQLAQLRLLNCEQAQGYYFSQPVDSTAAEAMLSAGLECNCSWEQSFVTAVS